MDYIQSFESKDMNGVDRLQVQPFSNKVMYQPSFVFLWWGALWDPLFEISGENDVQILQPSNFIDMTKKLIITKN